MDDKSYLNPTTMKSMLSTMKRTLEQDNDAYDIVIQRVTEFANANELKSEAFVELRGQMKDYVTVVKALKSANKLDIADNSRLVNIIGDEVLIGSNILSQKNSSWSSKERNEGTAADYRTKCKNTIWPWMKLYYTCQAGHYDDLARIDYNLYLKWKGKEEKYDNIEATSCALFLEGEKKREVAKKALAQLLAAFSNGKYVRDTSAEWRAQLEELDKNGVVEDIEKELKDLGYSDEEITFVKGQNLKITYLDLYNMRASVGSEAVYLGENRDCIIYNGKIYSIYMPPSGPVYEPVYENTKYKSFRDVDFDLAAGLLGIDMEQVEKNEIRDRSFNKLSNDALDYNDPNVRAAVGLSALQGVEQFVLNAFSSDEVYLSFQEAPGGARRVIISVGSSDSRNFFSNMNYGVQYNTYKNSEGVYGMRAASEWAKMVYQFADPNATPSDDKTYTLVGMWDERHKDSNIHGYLAPVDGKLMYIPYVLPGDSAYVATCDQITGFHVEEVCDFTDKLRNPSEIDADTMEILEKALEMSNVDK